MSNKRIVKSEGTKPCGCHVVEYSDDTSETTPCPPCGFISAAQALQAAANAIGAVANGLRAQMQKEAMRIAVEGAIKGKP